MLNRDKFFIEVDCCQCSAKGQIISGDVYIQRRYKNRVLLVLTDGAGTGIKSNIIANVVASMAINYTILDESATRTAESIVSTFAYDQESHGVKSTKFTIVDIHETGYVKIMEYGNPSYVFLHDGIEKLVDKDMFEIAVGNEKRSVYVSEFQAMPEDRIVFVSDGITDSGLGTRRMPTGWQRTGIVSLVEKVVAETPTVSAHHLGRKILGKAEINDLFTIKSDMSCASVYFRQPRKILVCSGPPFNEKKDAILADMVKNYNGAILICGGTTAQIVSRELDREINVELKRDPAGLPPTSSMEGVDLITEGVLTLSKVKSLLEKIATNDITDKGTDAIVAKMFLSHDIIEFVVGTRINPMHQDPNLPVELELRRNLIKEMARLLETKFMKEVKIQFI